MNFQSFLASCKFSGVAGLYSYDAAGFDVSIVIRGEQYYVSAFRGDVCVLSERFACSEFSLPQFLRVVFCLRHSSLDQLVAMGFCPEVSDYRDEM